jgi:2-dehydro-3-deoxyphosphogalactonate aldolase
VTRFALREPESLTKRLDDALRETPIIAILRGVRPDEIYDIAAELVDAGVRVIEVPLNSPDPLTSIAALAQEFHREAVIGAGTVVLSEDVQRVAGAGGQIVVAPNADVNIISRALSLGLSPIPGFFSPSEAYLAINAGATRLKLFPASTGGPQHLAALRATIPAEIQVYAVGGVKPSEFYAWRAAGAFALGLGSELYRPGQSAQETAERARMAVKACKLSA